MSTVFTGKGNLTSSDFLCADWSRAMFDKIMWWWRSLFFSLSCKRFSKKLQRKWTSKTVSVITVESNNFPRPILLSIIEMTSKCSQPCCETTHLWLVPPKFWTFWCHFFGQEKYRSWEIVVDLLMTFNRNYGLLVFLMLWLLACKQVLSTSSQLSELSCGLPNLKPLPYLLHFVKFIYTLVFDIKSSKMRK